MRIIDVHMHMGQMMEALCNYGALKIPRSRTCDLQATGVPYQARPIRPALS